MVPSPPNPRSTFFPTSSTSQKSTTRPLCNVMMPNTWYDYVMDPAGDVILTLADPRLDRQALGPPAGERPAKRVRLNDGAQPEPEPEPEPNLEPIAREAVTFQVSSRHLSLASHVFRAASLAAA